MSTYAIRRRERRGFAVPRGASAHVTWLAGGTVLAFLVPYLLADTLSLQRDVYYGVYAAFAVALFVAWSRSTGQPLGASIRRRWRWAVSLGAAFGLVLAFVVVRSEEATARPDGLELVGAVVWRGVVYGLADGLLLSAFPILAVFAAFAGSRLAARLPGKVLIGCVALVASLAVTASYHAGYGDFRSAKIVKPVAGDVAWSVPTLVTLNPIGAPIAHAGMHTTAVLHSYETDVFLPPHE